MKDLKKEIQGQNVFLIGGGKSFNPEKHVPMLPSSRVICLNSSLEDFDKCLAVMWMDGSWYGSNTKLLRENRHIYAVEFNINVQFLETRNMNRLRVKNVSCTPCDYNTPREKYNVCGNNVGCCAIDLLDQLKAKTIYLLGFDCREESGKSHYHNRYKTFVKQDTYNKNFIPCFNKLSKHIKNSKVINLSENTRINCFKKSNINNLMEGNYN